MSKFYKKSNAEGSRALFLKSQVYRGAMINTQYTNLRNFRIAESLLYGRVDRNYISIEPAPTVAFEQIGRVITPGNTHRVLKFVAAAFKDLERQFRVKAMSGHIRSDDQYLSTLEVTKAYESPRTYYDRFIAGRREGIITKLRTRNRNFKDFDGFLLSLMPILKSEGAKVPFTYPGFVRSAYCPPNTSGLVLEIADLDADNDQQKIENFKKSPNWEFYLNACRSYGFYVDAANPARLVANIGSSEMVRYAQQTSKCNFLSTQDILTHAYDHAHVAYYEGFKQALLTFYNQAKRPYMEVEYCQGGNVLAGGGPLSAAQPYRVDPLRYTVEDLTEYYGEAFFVELYVKMRLMEETETGMSDYEKETLTRDTVRMSRVKSVSYALKLFETMVSRPYDYSGSLTNLLYRDTVRKEEAINVLSNT